MAAPPLGGWILRAAMVPHPTEEEGLPIDLESCRELLPAPLTSIGSGIQMAVGLKGK